MAPVWPVNVAKQARVETDPTDASTAAWGDPAIIARCGVTALEPTPDPCVTVDGIDWVVTELTDGAALATFGRTPAIEVLVPDAYGPAALLAPNFTAAAELLPTNDLRCR